MSISNYITSVMYSDPSGFFVGFAELLGVVAYDVAYVVLATVVYVGLAETGILDGFNTFTDEVVDGFKNIVQKAALVEVEGASALVKKSIRYRKYEYHHIVPRKASACHEAQVILGNVGIGIDSMENLIILEYGTHRHFHTTKYYTHVNNVIKAAYNKDDTFFANRMRVEAALAELRLEIQMGVW